MKKKNKKLIIIAGILLLIIVFLISRASHISPRFRNYFKTKIMERENFQTIEEVLKEELTSTGYLEVPFICQAPLETEANWVYHEESCEEAATLQAYLYKTNQTLTKQEAHEEILKMIDWQIEHMGSHHDLYAEEMKEFITGYYESEEDQVRIIYNASLEDIKSEIDKDNPVIVPITGEILQNPYYPYPGYHMLTVIGYTEDRIITNDNGTRRGADFSYDNNIFMRAMNDASGDVLILDF